MTEHKKTFHLYGGKKFNDLKGLAKELKDMGEEVFDHHVNKVKNDFSAWMKHSLKEEKLATKIEKTIDRLEIELEVLRHLVHDAKVSASKKRAAAKKKVEAKKKAPIKKKVVKKVTKKKAAKKAVKKK